MQLAHQGAAEFLVGKRGIDQIAYAVGTLGCIIGYSSAEIAETLGRIVEAGDGLVQAGSVKIIQHAHKTAKGTAAFAEYLRVFHKVITHAAIHKGVRTPKIAVGIHGAHVALSVADHAQGLTLGVAAHGADAFAQVMRNALDVFHHRQRFGEYILIDALHHKLRAVLSAEQIGIVDMSAAKGYGFAHSALG